VPLELLAWHLDEPNADMSTAGYYLLSELAAGEVTVALSGQGADELLAGYVTHQAAVVMAACDRLPGPVRRAAGRLPGWAPPTLQRAGRALAAPDLAARFLEMTTSLDSGLRRELAVGPLAARDGGAALRATRWALEPAPADPLAAALRVDARLTLVDDLLLYFDRLSMAHSLEVRVTFLDHHVVERCARIPGDLKLRRMRKKDVLKRAARGVVPEEITDKRKVGFLTTAVHDWVLAHLKGQVSDYLLDPGARCAEFLDRDRLARMVTDFPKGAGLRSSRLVLIVLMLEVWLSSYLPRALAPPGGDQQPAST
jgi:asparagine synthase (glutamine-hydrolysing)